MTRHDLREELAGYFDHPNKSELRSEHPPATPAQIAEVTARAVDKLGVPLSPEYVSLISVLNGGGYDVCFYSMHDHVVKPFGRELISLGIIDRNHQLRKSRMTHPGELAYAQGEGSIFMPDQAAGTWI